MKLFPKDKKYSLREIIVVLSLTIIWNQLIYNGSKLITKSWHHYDMTTKLDELIPYTPWTITIYFGCYIFWCINYYMSTLQSSEERDRFFCGDALGKLMCLIFFIAIPTTNVRPEITGDLNFWDHCMKFLYLIDSPDNLFPSIHCLASWMCWIGVRKRKDVSTFYKYLSLIAAIAVCISTITTRQHVIADAIAGILLAELGYMLAGIPKVCNVYKWVFYHIAGLFKKKVKS